jgi:internalin A
MRRFGGILGVLAMSLLLCSIGRVRGQTYVDFPDPNLEAAVRNTLGIPTGPLTASDVRALTYLYAGRMQITNLSGLEYATNLTTLSLPYNALSDVSMVARLGNLLYLNLQHNDLGDVQALAGLSHLLSLDCSMNVVRDAAPLLALTNLTSLAIGHNPLTNSPVVAGLVSLGHLYMDQLSITDPGFLNGLTNLTTLDLARNQIGMLPPLPGLQQLTSLSLEANPLTNGAALANLSNLDTLVLNYCALADVGSIPQLTRLQCLYLGYNYPSDVAPLAGMTNLDVLAVTGNAISNAAVLGSLTKLTGLHAASCLLTNIDFVASLSGLETLNVYDNHITNLAPVLELGYLQYLYLDKNRLTSISGLDSLPMLKMVSLTENLLDVSTGSPTLTLITNLQARGVSVYYLPQNQPPAIGIPVEWAVPMNRTSSLPFYVYDDVTPASRLVVTVASANTNLVPDTGLVLQHFGDDVTWTLSLTPSVGQTGATTLTFIAKDDTGLIATNSLSVTIFYSPAVTIPDVNLEAAVRSTLNQPAGPLTAYDMQSLTWLNGGMASITNLTGLEWATNLTWLDLYGNAITDLRPLNALPNLDSLDLSSNNLRDLSTLQGLTNISRLSLDGNPVGDLSVLAGLPNLESLSAASCGLRNLVGFGALVHLQSLSLGYNTLSDMTPLAGLTNLTYLDLQGNPLGGTSGLAALTRLTTLTATRCSLSNLNGLQSLTNLESLVMGYNGVRDLSPLAGSTNLSYLSLDSNPIYTVAALAGLPRLTTLTWQSCSLTNLDSVHGLTSLQSLYVGNNSIYDLTPLAGLTNLSALYLTGNSPGDLAPLGVLSKLSTLDLADCSLTNAAALAALTQLRSLSLAYDFITDLSPLLGLTNSYSLNLSGNRITNISTLQNLSGLRFADLTRNLLDLSAHSPTMTTITNLQHEGDWVNYIPQNEPPTFYNLRTNLVIRPNAAAYLQLSVIDDVTLPDKVSVTVTCSSAGPLSNSAVTLARNSYYIPPFPSPPIILPIPPQPQPGPTTLDATLGPPFAIIPYGGGASFWDLTVTPFLNQTGTMTLTLTATDDTGLSTRATILVTAATPGVLDGAFLGATNLVWQTGGNAPWFGQTNVSQNGTAAAQSGAVAENEESWLETMVTGPGILTFWWRMDAESWGSQVWFSTSRGGGLFLEGPSGWRRESVSIPAGECVLHWSYLNFGMGSPSNACWLDEVSFVATTPDFWVEPSTGAEGAPAGVTLHGEPGALYEVQVSTNLSDWTPLSRVVLDLANGGFTAWVNDPSTGGDRRFYRGRQLPPGTMWFAPLTFDLTGSPVLRLYSQARTACEILASTNLLTWSSLATVTNTTGTLSFTNAQAGVARQFYNARQVR